MIKGIVRNLDSLGRITVPVEVRRRIGLETERYADIRLDGNIIRVGVGRPVGAKGIVRKLDSLGRITIPKEFRKTLHISDGDPVDMWLEGEEVCIQKATSGCEWCGNTEDLIEVNGHQLCRKCALAVIDAIEEA